MSQFVIMPFYVFANTSFVGLLMMILSARNRLILLAMLQSYIRLYCTYLTEAINACVNIGLIASVVTACELHLVWLWCSDVLFVDLFLQVARKLAMVEADLERAEERAEAGEK